MWRKTSRFLSWVCLLSYALILSFTGIAVWRARDAQRESARLEFDELAAFVAAAWPQAGSRGERFDEEAFEEALRDSVRFSRALVSVRLSEPAGREYTASKDGPSSRPALLSPLSYKPGAFFTPRKASITTSISGTGLTLDAQSSWIDPALLQRILLKALAALLMPLALSIGLFVLEVKAFGEQVGSGKWEVVSGQKRDAEAERTTEIYPDSPQDFRAETLPTTHYPLPTSSSHSQLPTPNQQLPTSNFLFSLSASLEEAVLLDGELSLAAVFCGEEGRKAEIARFAVQAFGEKAVFERDGRTIFVILPWAAFEEAQKIVGNFAETLENNIGAQAAIGISARQGRTVASSRLAEEALEAAKKAAADSGASAGANAGADGGGGVPVVTFRVDPQKWAEFAGSFEGRS